MAYFAFSNSMLVIVVSQLPAAKTVIIIFLDIRLFRKSKLMTLGTITKQRLCKIACKICLSPIVFIGCRGWQGSITTIQTSVMIVFTVHSAFFVIIRQIIIPGCPETSQTDFFAISQRLLLHRPTALVIPTPTIFTSD